MHLCAADDLNGSLGKGPISRTIGRCEHCVPTALCSLSIVPKKLCLDDFSAFLVYHELNKVENACSKVEHGIINLSTARTDVELHSSYFGLSFNICD